MDSGSGPTQLLRAHTDDQPTGRSAVEILCQQIRNLITTEGLSIGDSLPSERELCERFSTSRNTVREAMRMLKAYGIVDVRPKVGATIVDNRMARAIDLFSFNPAEVSFENFRDVQGMRALVEVASVDQLFERATDEALDELEAINRSLAMQPHLSAASEVDFQFHMHLVGILGNRAIQDVYSIMKPIIIRIMKLGKTRLSFRTSVFDQHHAVIAALRARDRISYQYALQSHLDAGFANFHSALEEKRE